jgi:hypothetical protein
MRFLSHFSALALLPLAAFGGGADYAPASAQAARSHVRIQVEADRLILPLTVTVRGKNRTAVDARIEAIRRLLEQRVTDQPGCEVWELSSEFARAEGKSSRTTSTSSKLFGDEETKGEVTYVALARWELRVKADQGLKGLEALRAKTDGLTDGKSEDEKSVVGHPEYALTNPQDYRDPLLERIKADFEEAKKHLPEGQWTLELPGLANPVNVVALGGKRFELSLGYRLAFLTPKLEKSPK